LHCIIIDCQEGYVFIYFVCLSAQLRKNYTDFFKQNSVERWHIAKLLDLDGNPDHFVVGLGLWSTASELILEWG